MHPVTTGLLDAGVALLLEDLGLPADDADTRPPRLFEAITAGRVCTAATRRGPLRVTEGHLRDRWPRQDHFVDDLLAYGLWWVQWRSTVESGQEAIAPPPGAPSVDELPRLAEAMAEIHLYEGQQAVIHRLELVCATFAASRPVIRALRSQGYEEPGRAHGDAYARLLTAMGLRLREGVTLEEQVIALEALAEGANLRRMPCPRDPLARRAAIRTMSVGGRLLVPRFWEPAATGEHLAAPTTSWPSVPVPVTLPDVLERLTDPCSGTRRTQAGRRRLAEDPITRQLLDGGMACLSEDLEVTGQRTSRAFDALSGARVVARAREMGGPGAQATVAQLRDRWALQEHYVDDLVTHALRLRTSVVDALAGEPPTAAGAADAVAEHLRRVRQSPGSRLRLLVTALASGRAGVAGALLAADDAERRRLTTVLRGHLEQAGLELDPDVDAGELSGWLLALCDGVEIRMLATAGPDDDSGLGALLLRTATALIRECCRPHSAGGV